jgi:large subunit ribosomal protein L1
MAIGKASFDAGNLLDNFTAVLEEIVRAKPASAKGKYIISCTLATSMGPGIRVDASKIGDRELVGATTVAGGDETAAEPATA